MSAIKNLLYEIRSFKNMSNILKLFFTTNPVNFINGEPQIDTDFGKVLDSNFDLIPLKGNKNYSLYNDMVISIRNARRKDSDFIEVTKSDIEQLKQILIAATADNSRLNRIVSFLTEIIDNTISGGVIATEIIEN